MGWDRRYPWFLDYCSTLPREQSRTIMDKKEREIEKRLMGRRRKEESDCRSNQVQPCGWP